MTRKIIKLDSNRGLEGKTFDMKRSDKHSSEGDGEMANFVTREELKATKEAIEQKIELAKSELSHDITKSSIDIKEAIDNQSKEQRKDLKDSRRWIVGTVIALLGIFVTILKVFFL